jgi:hypothetical protein
MNGSKILNSLCLFIFNGLNNIMKPVTDIFLILILNFLKVFVHGNCIKAKIDSQVLLAFFLLAVNYKKIVIHCRALFVDQSKGILVKSDHNQKVVLSKDVDGSLLQNPDRVRCDNYFECSAVIFELFFLGKKNTERKCIKKFSIRFEKLEIVLTGHLMLNTSAALIDFRINLNCSS